MSKVNTIIEELKTLSLLEAAELVKSIEETFGVSASAPVAMASAPAGGDAPAAVEEKSAIIKIVKDKKSVGLGEAKTIVESAPFTLAEKISKEEANKLKDELSAAGATVTLK